MDQIADTLRLHRQRLRYRLQRKFRRRCWRRTEPFEIIKENAKNRGVPTTFPP
jgi:hypothetical protein